jgi:hypothetical protein
LRRADRSSKESYQLSISVRLWNLIKRRPRPDMGWSAIEEEEEEEAEEEENKKCVIVFLIVIRETISHLKVNK